MLSGSMIEQLVRAGEEDRQGYAAAKAAGGGREPMSFPRLGDQPSDFRIEPFDPARVNPNSYNVRLGDKLLQVRPNHWSAGQGIIHPGKPQQTDEVLPELPYRDDPGGGFLIYPNTLYLGSTMERICGGRNWVPFIDGRSSVGRLGVTVHITAGAGDIGFDGVFTLEIAVLHNFPVLLFPGMELGQVRFEPVQGDPSPRYEGGYTGQTGPVPSKVWKEYANR